MKNFLLTIILITVFKFMYAQWEDCTMNFEQSAYCGPIILDTISNANNIWQIGQPHKQEFISAFSSPNVIVTDTLNPYPINDTSSFIRYHTASFGFFLSHTVVISGYYWVDSDTLSDFGKIEFSPDKGISWVDVINDSLGWYCPEWNLTKPVLSGNSGGWKYFWVRLACFGPIFNIQLDDTVLYRFTFISDSVQTGKDGLMFDDLNFQDWAEGIQEIHGDQFLQIFPNPASNHVIVKIDKSISNGELLLINSEGKAFVRKEIINPLAEIDLSNLPLGLYGVIFRNEKFIAIDKLMLVR